MAEDYKQQDGHLDVAMRTLRLRHLEQDLDGANRETCIAFGIIAADGTILKHGKTEDTAVRVGANEQPGTVVPTEDLEALERRADGAMKSYDSYHPDALITYLYDTCPPEMHGHLSAYLESKYGVKKVN